MADPREVRISCIGVISCVRGDTQLIVSGYFTMTWDQVCTEFEAISYNWNPALWPSKAIRHWYVPTTTHYRPG